jgi:hypothetical protein
LRAVLRRVVLLALQLVLLPAQHVRQVLAPVQLVRQALVQAQALAPMLVQALAPVLQLLALNRFCR